MVGDADDACTQIPSGSRILVVDDDPAMRSLLTEVLSEEGYEVRQSANAAEALICLRTQDFAVIILDKNMPGLSGLDILPGLRTLCPKTAVILITAFGDVGTYVEAMEKGVFEYIFKPFRIEELLRVLSRALSSEPATAPTSVGSGGTAGRSVAQSSSVHGADSGQSAPAITPARRTTTRAAHGGGDVGASALLTNKHRFRL